MPQLLPFYFVNMLSYSFLLFIVILYVLSTYILPKYNLLFAIRMSLLGNNTPQFILVLFCILILFEGINESEGLLSFLVPMMIYPNADTNKLQILLDNKGRAAIYMWTHNESGKKYIGSAVNLSERMSSYFSSAHLERFRSMYIYNALLLHRYSAFSLSILVYIDIPTNLTKVDVRKLILEHEQYYLDLIFSLEEPNSYNILQVAGSRLGSKHTEDSLAKISLAISGENHPMFGRTGEDHPNYGRTHSTEAKALIGKAHKDKTLSAETKSLISKALNKKSICV